mmetsp:Transcript_3539/g.7788  ORF Transcript_3539/g.7788 Transcript_3539/m.7788 type:complete len:494 (+) Transcript_3539:120-1601(+)|eukprot:CAMPEP_0183715770 /NCGR_PEP_ID=MMETSP0737-20130205/9878_1 /TAXON_ID=385413 /ORGANISM="Thalassiosira miniscula, Strain CCMP1093" /LENGTH=493 /DNA_ID=CAMNT_0025944921 /DNA_START=58 /DNA_END=1539 /DNA_ORIENTATION=-
MATEASRELEAAKQRLAAAKSQAASATSMMETANITMEDALSTMEYAKKCFQSAEKARSAAQFLLEGSREEISEAVTKMKEAEMRWEAMVHTTGEEGDSEYPQYAIKMYKKLSSEETRVISNKAAGSERGSDSDETSDAVCENRSGNSGSGDERQDRRGETSQPLTPERNPRGAHSISPSSSSSTVPLTNKRDSIIAISDEIENAAAEAFRYAARESTATKRPPPSEVVHQIIVKNCGTAEVNGTYSATNIRNSTTGLPVVFRKTGQWDGVSGLFLIMCRQRWGLNRWVIGTSGQMSEFFYITRNSVEDSGMDVPPESSSKWVVDTHGTNPPPTLICMRDGPKTWELETKIMTQTTTATEDSKNNSQLDHDAPAVAVPTEPPSSSFALEGPLQQITVDGCGIPEVNGTYSRSSRPREGFPKYTKRGTYDGQAVKFAIFCARPISGTHRYWAIGIPKKRVIFYVTINWDGADWYVKGKGKHPTPRLTWEESMEE